MNKLIMNYKINLNSKDYNVLITRKKIKRLIIKVNHKNEILVSAPPTISNSDVLNRVFINSKWIEKQISKHDKIDDEFDVFGYLDRKIIYIAGKRYQLQEDKDLNSKFVLNDDTFFYKNNLKKTIELIYESHYHLLEDVFNNALDFFKNKVKQKPTLKIKKMKSRWGSCNYNTGEIVLNKMLISVPSELVKYVVYHEFTHLFFPNHSKDYYNLLNNFLSENKIYEKKLKKYSFLLTS